MEVLVGERIQLATGDMRTIFREKMVTEIIVIFSMSTPAVGVTLADEDPEERRAQVDQMQLVMRDILEKMGEIETEIALILLMVIITEKRGA